MVEIPGASTRYRVSYSERVREELKALLLRATQRGRGRLVLDAVRELDRRLQIYPQFGQPLRDLTLKPAQLWVGVVPPLVAHYSIDDHRRLVIVAVPISPLPNSNLDP